MPFTPIPIDADNPSLMTGSGNTTYLIASNGEACLVDAGTGRPKHLTELARHLDEQRSRLANVIVTHGHRDHASGAPVLARAYPGARLHKWLAGGGRRVGRVSGETDGGIDAVDWRGVTDGQVFDVGADQLQIVYTPGHAPDHVAIWHDASRTIFAGDLVMPGGSVTIDASGGGDLEQYLQSLERIRQMKPLRLLPAHGPAVDDPAALIRQHIDHRLARERQVLEALDAGRDTIDTIAEAIYPRLPQGLVTAARQNVRAHLEKLKREGRAFEEQSRWRR